MTYKEVLEEKCWLRMSHIIMFQHVSTIHRDACLLVHKVALIVWYPRFLSLFLLHLLFAQQCLPLF